MSDCAICEHFLSNEGKVACVKQGQGRAYKLGIGMDGLRIHGSIIKAQLECWVIEVSLWKEEKNYNSSVFSLRSHFGALHPRQSPFTASSSRWIIWVLAKKGESISATRSQDNLDSWWYLLGVFKQQREAAVLRLKINVIHPSCQP